MTTKKTRPGKIGDGFKAAVVAASLMGFVIAWDLVARRDAAGALAEANATPASPTPQPSVTPWPTLTPMPALAPLPTLAPMPDVETAGLTANTAAAVENAAIDGAVASVSIAPPPSLPTMPALAPLPEMPAPPPPPPPSKGGGGGGGGSRSKGS